MMFFKTTLIFFLCTVLWISKGDDSCPGLPTCFCNKDKTSVNCDGKHFTSVPETIPENVTKLYLRYNNFVEINSGTFGRYKKLEKLYLNNNKITKLNPNAFAGAVSLTYIDLRGNKLSSIGPNAFAQLPNLHTLYLLTNDLETIDDQAFAGTEKLQYASFQSNSLKAVPPLGRQPQLQKVILQGNSITNATFPECYAHSTGLQYIGLSNNKIETLGNGTFESLGNVSIASLYLSSNKIKRIDSGTFEHLATIKSLKLGQNPLNSTGLKVALESLQGKDIVSLDLSGLRLNGLLLKDTFKLLEDTAITSLDMRYNDIPKLINGSFTGLDDLLQLDLSNCKITVTEPGAFVGLDRLQILNLERNKLMSVPENMPPTLIRLFMDDNQIHTIRSMAFKNQVHLLELRIRYNKVHELMKDSFHGLYSLNKLNLMNNQIDTLPGEVFGPLVRLISLHIGQNTLYSIQNATGRFSSLGSLVYFNMADNNCHSFQSDMFKYMTSLQYLHLENNNLGGMIAADYGGELFRGLGKLEELYIMDNGVTEIHAPAFQDLTSLELLNLTNNKVKNWDGNLFKTTPHLKYIDLSSNLITVLKRGNLKLLKSLEGLNLTGNPFMCGCDLRWFRDWINHTSVQLVNVQSYTCTQPKAWSGKPLLSFDRTKINCLFFTWQEIVIICVSLAVVIIIVGVIVHRKRWSILLYYYKKRYGTKKTRAARDGRGKYGAINEDGKRFDAYISCAEEDKPWVVENLLYGVDKGGLDSERPFGGYFSLYYEDRDSEPGRMKVGEIYENMYNSRKVIVVLSKHYLSDRFHLFEMDQAIQAMYDGDVEEIIVAYIARGLPRRKIPKQLATTMRRHQMIEWEEEDNAKQLFKQQLLDKLSLKGDAANIDTD